MRKIIIGAMAVVTICFFTSNVFAFTVTVKAVSSGKYEDGEFEPGSSHFAARYIVNEEKGTVSVDKMINNDREGKEDDSGVYEITNTVTSEGISALLVSRNKKGQKIITAVREAELGASEILILGDDFYEFCRASNGLFYLEYGDVIRRDNIK